MVGVLFQSRYRTSANVADEVCRALQDSFPPARSARWSCSCVAIDLDAISALDSALKRKGVRVLYVSPLRAVHLEDVTAVSRAARITTLTGVPRYVETGLAIGVDMKGERPEIVINLAASRAEGADLTAHLLKLARVVGDERGRAMRLQTRLAMMVSLLAGGIAAFIFLYFPARLEQQALEAVGAKARSIGAMTAFSISPGLVFGDTRGDPGGAPGRAAEPGPGLPRGGGPRPAACSTRSTRRRSRWRS